MNKLLLIGVSALSLSAWMASGATGAKVTDKPVRVLYLGDSLTDYDRGSNHVDRLVAKIDAVQPRYVSIHNYAIRGDFIERMMNRLRGDRNTYALERYEGIWGVRYDWAFVFLGQNDSRAWSKTNFDIPEMPLDKVRALYTELVALLRGKGIGRIIFVTPASLNFAITSVNAQKQIDRIKAGKTKSDNAVRFGEPRHLENFCRVIREVAAKEGVEYLDIYSPMKALPDKPDYLKTVDGVHLSQKGHEFVAGLEFDYLVKNRK